MASSQLLRPILTATTAASVPSSLHRTTSLSFPTSFSVLPCRRRHSFLFVAKARGKMGRADQNPKETNQKVERPVEEEGEELEEEIPWLQDKALDLVEFTGTVAEAVPGPRVGSSKLPWILAIPLAYAGASFAIAFVKTVKKFTSPRAKRKRLVNKNAALLKSIDDLFVESKNGLQHSVLQDLMKQTGFTVDEILRKYIRYTLNEKPFNPDAVMDLISLRKASQLDDPQVAEVLNEVSRRIVKDKGRVVMDISGFTEKGFKRKLSVQVLFGKILYLSELPEFCSRDSSLMVKELFGVTDDDADTLRMHTLSKSGDVDTLEEMVYNSNDKGSSDEKNSAS